MKTWITAGMVVLCAGAIGVLGLTGYAQEETKPAKPTLGCASGACGSKSACSARAKKACCGSEACKAKKAKAACCGSAACKAKKAAGGEKACCGSEACKAKKAHAHADVATLDTKALKALVDAKVPATILDARGGKWDDGRRIPGAGSLTAAASDAEIAKAIPSKDGLVVTYCGGTKCPASAKLAGRLRELGYKNVVEYPQGIAGWAGAGLDVVKAE